MNLAVINSTILALCEEVDKIDAPINSWQDCSEDELLYEVAFCIFSSQTLYEVSVAATDRLKELNLFRSDSAVKLPVSVYEELVREAFEERLYVKVNGVERMVALRFRNRLSSLLAATVENIYGKKLSIRGILESAVSARHARELMIRSVIGFGPKQASLFLRRVGYCANLAVLDTHVVDYIKLANGTDIKPNFLSRLTSYEKIEVEFRNIAENFGYTVGCVDLAMWITMRVAKGGVAI